MNDPCISVLLAVYNGQRYLRKAVDSILGQSFGDFEFIIIDDGSTDATLKILREYERSDKRIRLVSRPNKGLTQTLNEGLALARGKYLARMDADDVSLPRRFELQVKHLEAHPDCVLVGTRVIQIDPAGWPIRPWATQTTHEEIDAAHLGSGWPVVHPSVMMPLEAVRKVGGYRDQYNTLEDLDLFLRLAEVGRLANLPEILLQYRLHFASVTHSKEQKQREIRQAIYDETTDRRGLPRQTRLQWTRMEPLSEFEHRRTWAWNALATGNVKTARKYAVFTLFARPLSLHSWKLFGCAIRGR